MTDKRADQIILTVVAVLYFVLGVVVGLLL